VVPIAAITAAASGPPKIKLAIIGAAATDTTVPRGRRTGSELAARAAAVQNAIPTKPPIASWTGNSK
jgi:hypothetical protein